MKKFLALFVALIMIVSMVPMVSAEEPGEVQYFGWADNTAGNAETAEETKRNNLTGLLAWAQESTFTYVGIIKAGEDPNTSPYYVKATKGTQKYIFFCENKEVFNTVKDAWSRDSYTLGECGENSGSNVGNDSYICRVGDVPIEGPTFKDWKKDSLDEILKWAHESEYAYVNIFKEGMDRATYFVSARKNTQEYNFGCENEEDYNRVKQLWSKAPYVLNDSGNSGNGGGGVDAGPLDQVNPRENATVVLYTRIAKDDQKSKHEDTFSGATINAVLNNVREYIETKNLVGAFFYVYLRADDNKQLGDLELVSGDEVYIYTVDGFRYEGAITFKNNTDGVRMNIRTGKYGEGAKEALELYSGCCYSYEESTATYIVSDTSHVREFQSSSIDPDNGSVHMYTQFTCTREGCGKTIRHTMHPEDITDIILPPDVNTGTQGIALEKCKVEGCYYKGGWRFGPLYLSARTTDETFIAMNTGFSPDETLDIDAWEFEHRDHDFTIADVAIFDLSANFSCKGDLTVPSGKTVWLCTDIYGKTYGDAATHKAAVFDGKFKFETGNGSNKGTLIVREGLYTHNPSAYVDKASGYRVAPVKGADFGLSEYKNLFLVYQGELKSSNVSISGDGNAMVNSGRKTLDNFEVATSKTLTATDNGNNSWNITPVVNAAHAVDTGKTAQRDMDTAGNVITVRVPVTSALAVDGLAVAVEHSKNGNEVETIYGTVVKDGKNYYAEFVTEKGFSTFAMSAHDHVYNAENVCACGAKQQKVGGTTVIFEETTVVPTVSGDITDETEKLIADTLAQQGVAIDVPEAVLNEPFVAGKIKELVDGKKGTIRIEPVVTATVKKITQEGTELDIQSVTFDLAVKLEVFVNGAKEGTVDLSNSTTSMNLTFPVLLWDEDTTVYVSHIKNGATKSTKTATVSANDTVTVTNAEGYSDFVLSLKAPSTNKPARPSYDPNKIQSPKTFDAGIAVYGMMALASAMGAAYVSTKKR